MEKTLIVYFSHKKENYVSGVIKELEIGNTEVIAKKFQSIIDADIFEIKPLHDYPFDYHECTEVAKKEQSNNERPKILNIVQHMEDYKNIYLGFPNWWGTMPMCVWTFLESYDFKDKRIYPFCTHEGSGLGSSIADIRKLCPNSLIENGLAIYGSKVNNADKKLNEWLKGK
jgi:flavodoxin